MIRTPTCLKFWGIRSVWLLLPTLAYIRLSAAPIIPNPSFEEGPDYTIYPGYVAGNAPIPGWTVSDASRAGLNPAGDSPFADNGAVPDGRRVAFLQSGSGMPTTLSTTISGLTPGRHYRLRFRANQRAATDRPEVTLRIAGGIGIPINASPSVNPEGEKTSSYYTITTLFTATAATVTVELTNQTVNDSAVLVDDFRVTEALPLVVTNALDSGPGSLRKVLNDAALSPECNVITFLPGLNNSIVALASELQIDDSSGVIVDASALREGILLGCGATAHRLLRVGEAASCSLRRISFLSGSDDAGGGVKNSGSLMMDQCSFYDCHASSDGGAIFNGGMLSLKSTSFTSSSSSRGGCLYNRGRALLEACSLFAGSADAGGAILNDDIAYCGLTVERSSFLANQAVLGAAIWNGAPAKVKGSRFEGNSTTAEGGAIFASGPIQVSASLFKENSAGAKGGAFYNSQAGTGRALLVRCTLNGNEAAVSGGGIHNALGEVMLEQCTIALNEAALGGGIASMSSATCATSAVGCIIARNTSGQVDLAAGDGVNSFVNCEKNILGVNGGTGSESFTGQPVEVSNADVGLQDLSDNGGPTLTMALTGTSVARNNGWVSGAAQQTDQRGFPIVGIPDAGAYEVQSTGSFHFRDPSYSVEEPAGLVNVTVTRDGDFEGAAQVMLKTMAGTAGSSDYTPLSQVLNFADGEGEKTVSLTINVDMVVEKNESFKVELSSPSSGYSLRAPSSATVVIVDPSSHAGSDTVAPPPPTIDSPSPNTVLKLRTGEGLTISGTATDNKGVAQVLYRVGNSGPFSSADLQVPCAATTKWSASITPGAGARVLEVQVQDNGGNLGSISRQTFKVQRPLQVHAMGAGTGSFTAGFMGESFRDVNMQYTVSATPSPGSLFTGWSIGGGFSAADLDLLPGALQKPTLRFTFREHLILYANFVPCPYLTLAGDYMGLVRAANAADRSSTEGMFNITTQSTGAFSGKLIMDGLVLGVTGAFDESGVARFGTGRTTTVTVARTGKPSLALSLAMNLDPARVVDSVSGTVASKFYLQSATPVESAFTAARAIYNAANPVPGDYLGAGGATQPYTGVFSAKQQYDPVSAYINGGNYKVSLGGASYAEGDSIIFVTSPSGGPAVDTIYTLGPPTGMFGQHLLFDLDGGQVIFTGSGNCYVAINNRNPQKEGVRSIDYPQGDGFASLAMSKAGVVAITGGKLADGTAVTASSKVVAGDKFPLFIPLYGSKGWLSGEVALDCSNAESDMSAVGNKLEWLRPADYKKQHYPAGWPEVINVSFMAARYATSFSPASSVLRRADSGDPDQLGDALGQEHATMGNAMLSFYEGLLSSPFSRRANVSASNRVDKIPSNDSTMSLALTVSTGGFNGKFLHELDDGDGALTPPLTDFQGIIFQKGSHAGGYGYFLTRQPAVVDFTGQSGAVTLMGR